MTPQIAGCIFSKTVSMCSSLLAPKSAILLLVFNLVTSYLKFSDKLPYTMAEGEADEIYWVNKLLAIEDMDWSC